MAGTSALVSCGTLALALSTLACGGSTPRGPVSPESGADVTPADADAFGDVVVSDGLASEVGPSQDACADAPSPSPSAFPGGPPADLGCYVKTATGWQRVPCNCELPLANAGHSPIEVQLTLTVTPENLQPVLSGSPAFELRIEDRDSVWYTLWASKLAGRTDVAATHVGGVTTIRLGTRVVTLDPVPLAACQVRSGQASVTGVPPWATLEMRATVVQGGQQVPLIVSWCVNIPRQ
jgi:hypothetical protein